MLGTKRASVSRVSLPCGHRAVARVARGGEPGRFSADADQLTKRWRYTVTPSKLAEKVAISGDLWVESRGEKSIERVCTGSVAVKMFGVGSMVEKFITEQTRGNYDRVAAFTDQYIREKAL